MGSAEISTLVMSIITFAVPTIFAITIHEAAHGYVARYFGDMTAAALGRITLNPLKHIDPIGTIVLPIMVLVISMGSFAFGYAKPVPVNFSRLRNPKRDMLWVAFAGPASNILQTLFWALVMVVVVKFGMNTTYLFKMAYAGIIVNLVLCVLNLFPLPPLDGGRILVSLLPHQLAYKVARIEPYGFMILLALLFLDVLSKFWISPLVNLGMMLIDGAIFRPFGL